MFSTQLGQRTFATTVAALALGSIGYAGVLVVDPAGLQGYTQISAAVLAAHDGDVVLVKAGTYGGFTIDAKSISVVADVSGPVLVRGSCFVRNVGATGRVVLSGLDVGYATAQAPAAGSQGEALLVTNNSGALRIQGCALVGKSYGSPFVFSIGGAGLRAEGNVGSIAIASSQLTGGRGSSHTEYGASAPVPGGAGLDMQNSRAALYDCTLTGGRGGDGFNTAGTGGHATWSRSSTSASGLFASNSTFTGGRGGDDWEYIFADQTAPGDGGDGLRLDAGTAAQVLDCTFVGGPVGVGIYCYPSIWVPVPGAGVAGAGTLFTFAVPSLSLDAGRVVREGTPLAVTVQGEPGDNAYLWFSRGTAFTVVPSWRGVVIPSLATPARAMILGTIDASGVLSTTVTVPMLPAALSALDQFLQVYRRDSSGSVTLGSFGVVTTLDAAY